MGPGPVRGLAPVVGPRETLATGAGVSPARVKHWYQVQVFQAVSRRLAARASAIARSEPHTWPHSSYTAVSETA
jgi:hypothetical protein